VAMAACGFITVFSDALHYDVPAHISSWLGLRASDHKGGIPVKTPSFFPVSI
jgi:hypothetical protein